MKRNRKQLKTRNGIWVARGEWTPTYVINQQKQDGIEYQTYAVDAEGKCVHAGVTHHEHMNRAIAKQIQAVWLRWRNEYDNIFTGKGQDYPAKHVNRVTTLYVFPVDHPEQQEVFAV